MLTGEKDADEPSRSIPKICQGIRVAKGKGAGMHGSNLLVALVGAALAQEMDAIAVQEPTRTVCDNTVRNGRSAPYEVGGGLEAISCSKRHRARAQDAPAPSRTRPELGSDFHSLLQELPKPETIFESVAGFPALEPQPSSIPPATYSYQDRVIQIMDDFKRKVYSQHQ